MNGFYLCDFNPFDETKPDSGVDKKVKGQIECFNKNGLGCTFIEGKRSVSKIRKGLGTLPGIPDGVRWPDASMLAGADYLYIRKPMFITKEFVEFLDAFKRVNPSSRTVLELPTYPYDKEVADIKLKPGIAKDRKYRKQLSGKVDFISDLSGHEEIFGIPTLQMINGIDLDQIGPRKIPQRDDDVINIAFSAFFAPWHGADRVLYGLKNYLDGNPTKVVMVHFIGEGPSFEDLKALASDLEVEGNVIFHGFLDDDQSAEVFDFSTIAISSLGLHRIVGPDVPASSLKTREYLAKGIPFVHSNKVDVFENKPVDFCLEIPPNEDPLDFDEVLAFHDELYKNEPEANLIKRIRKYAEDNVSMNAAMKNIVNALACK